LRITGKFTQKVTPAGVNAGSEVKKDLQVCADLQSSLGRRPFSIVEQVNNKSGWL
jgi:hypothetical protein